MQNIRRPHERKHGNSNPNTITPNECIVREQDRFMPIANYVVQIMWKVLPPQVKIVEDAKCLVQECVSEFIGFITSKGRDSCNLERPKSTTAKDVLWAVEELGFDNYVMLLTRFLQKYRPMEGNTGGSMSGEPSSSNREISSLVLNPCGGGALDPRRFHCPTVNDQQLGIYDGANTGNYYYAMSGYGPYGGSAVVGDDGSGGTGGISHQPLLMAFILKLIIGSQ